MFLLKLTPKKPSLTVRRYTTTTVHIRTGVNKNIEMIYILIIFTDKQLYPLFAPNTNNAVSVPRSPWILYLQPASLEDPYG